MSTVPNRFLREKKYIGVWPGDDNPVLKYASDELVVPATNEVAEAGKGRFRFGSARDRAGRPIPGTLVIADRYTSDGGTAQKVFDAEDFLNGLHSVNEALMARGFRVVNEPEEVESARREGRAAWEDAQQIADEETLRLELARQARWSAKNPDLPVPRGSDDTSVRAAIDRLKNRQVNRPTAVKRDEVVAALGGAMTATPSITAADFEAIETATPTAPPEPVKDEGPSIEQIAKHLYEMSEEHSVTLSKGELKGLLSHDATTLESVRAKLEEAGVALSL